LSASWCQANRCERRVTPGQIFCGEHLERIPELGRAELGRIDPRPLLEWKAPVNLDTHGRLKVIADAVELIAIAERQPVGSQWRRWEVQMRTVLSRGQQTQEAQP
jgi:hypothetical protein